MKYWIVSAEWNHPDGGPAGMTCTFADEAEAQAFIQNGDPCAGSPFPRSRPADPAQVVWKVTTCDLAAQPWICSLNRASGFSDAVLERYNRAVKTVLTYYLGQCDNFLAFFDCTGTRREGALTQEWCQTLARGDLFGLQLYKGKRTLFHLDDGCDYAFIVDAAVFRDLTALGVQPWQLRPERAADTIDRAGPDWTGH